MYNWALFKMYIQHNSDYVTDLSISVNSSVQSACDVPLRFQLCKFELCSHCCAQGYRQAELYRVLLNNMFLQTDGADYEGIP